VVSGVLSVVSGKFVNSLILGAFLPTVVFVLLGYVLLVPLVPTQSLLLKPLESLDTQWRVIVISFLTIVLSGLLYNLNGPIIRFYEGYAWQSSWLGRWRTRRYQAKFDAARAQILGMETLRARLYEDDRRLNDVIDLQTQVSVDFGSTLPFRRDLVLPTRLGNIIRSFEMYGLREYGLDTIPMWPRLMGIVDDKYISKIDDARVIFDFMMNSSVLNAIFAALALFIGLSYLGPFSSPLLYIPWLLTVVMPMILAYVFYLISLRRAQMWGGLVMGAVDLYHNKLLDALGYTRKFKDRDDERELWQRLSRRMLFHFGFPDMRPPYVEAAAAPAPTSVQGDPTANHFEIAKGWTGRRSDGLVEVTVVVRSLEKTGQVTDVIVTDTMPPGYEYVWESARVDGRGSIPVSGYNPYRFQVTRISTTDAGSLAAGDQIALTYLMLSHAEPDRAERDAVAVTDDEGGGS
jgi:hypothetical protein